MEAESIFVLIPVVAIIGGISVAIAAIISTTKVRELRIRERIAMIEKGLVPPPEVDPDGFDRAMRHHDWSAGRRRERGPGLRRAGVMVLSIGIGMTLLIAVAGGSVRAGIGVGGFLMVIGVALLINSLFEADDRYADLPPGSPAAQTPSQK
jgi:hypothetical protein